MLRMLVVLVVALGLGVSFMGLSVATPTIAFQSTPEAVAPPVITSEVLGRAAPAEVDNPELALGRVTIMPGAVIPVHFHPGTQIGVVVQGALTYTVYTGEVVIFRAHGGAPEHVGANETVVLETGDAIVEQPGEIHQGRNDGSVPLVLYLSTLFPTGEPRSILVEATPAP